MNKSDSQRYPFPELVSGEDWTVVEGIPSVDFGRNLLSIPLQDNPIAHNVRTHTQAKLKWSSDLVQIKIRASVETISALDDLRITHLLQRRAQINTYLGYMPENMVTAYLEGIASEGVLKNMCLFYICNGRTQYQDKVKSKLESLNTRESKLAIDFAEEAFRSLDECQFLDTNDLKKISEALEYRFKESELNKPKNNNTQNKQENSEESVNNSEEMLQNGLDEMNRRLSRREWRIDLDYNEWGELTFEYPPLIHSLKRRSVQRKLKNTVSGTVLGDYSRFYGDGKIWRNYGRVLGGSILLDMSGSMSISQQQIELIVKTAPALTIATYSGTGDKGKIRIIVKNGRICSPNFMEAPGGGWNIVDGPCLQKWLALQSTPRIWLSDGWVNGKNGKSSQNLFDDAMNLCRKYSIIRVNSINTAMKFFAKLELGNGNVHPALRKKQNEDIEKFKLY